MFLLGDLGGSKIRLGFSPDGKIIEDPKLFDAPEDFTETINLISAEAKNLARIRPIKAACFGVAAILNKDLSEISYSPNNQHWSHKPIKEDFEKALNCKVFLENDTAIVGLGEALTGPGLGKEIVVYVTVSTGVGGVRIINGKIDKKNSGFEPGHQIIEINSNSLCSCGQFGHLEAFISGSSLGIKYGKLSSEIKDPEVWDEVSKYLAVGLNNIILHWSPDIIVLGGSVMESISLQKTKEELDKILKIVPIPEIELAKLDEIGGLYGALEYLKQQSSVY